MTSLSSASSFNSNHPKTTLQHWSKEKCSLSFACSRTNATKPERWQLHLQEDQWHLAYDITLTFFFRKKRKQIHKPKMYMWSVLHQFWVIYHRSQVKRSTNFDVTLKWLPEWTCTINKKKSRHSTCPKKNTKSLKQTYGNIKCNMPLNIWSSWYENGKSENCFTSSSCTFWYLSAPSFCSLASFVSAAMPFFLW